MNIPEGARRIQYVGRVMLAVSAALLAFVLLLTLIARFTNVFPNIAFGVLPMLILGAYPGMIGIVFVVIGWIVEGFAAPPRSGSSGD